MALCPENPKRDQNPKFTPLSETTSIPDCFKWEFGSKRGDPLATIARATLLSYMRLVEARASKLGLIYVSNILQAARSGMSMCANVHDRNGMVNYKPGEYTREMLFNQKHRQLRRKKLLRHM